MTRTLALLIIGVVVGAAGLYAYQNTESRSQASEFVGGILNSVSEAPDLTPTAPAMAALPAPTATPVRVAPVQVTPMPIATPAPPPSAIPEHPSPTGAPTSVPAPTPTPAPYSIEVVSMKPVADGQVDFLLEVRNESDWASDEVAQVEMSVDGGAPELVNIIVNLPQGESASFTFARSLAPGPHVIRFSVGDSHTAVSVNVESDDVTVSSPTPYNSPTPTNTATPTATLMATVTPSPIPSHTPTPAPTVTLTPISKTVIAPDLRHIEEKLYMLELINVERAKAGLRFRRPRRQYSRSTARRSRA